MLNKALQKALERGTTRTTHDHHIIARRDDRADEARTIWLSYGLNINDQRNLVKISVYLHYYVHTTAYFEAINAIVKIADKHGKSGVLKAVKFIKSLLATISYISKI